MSNVNNGGLRTLDEIRASRAQPGDLDQVANQIVQGESAWWGIEHADLAAGPADIHRMIAAGMSEVLPTPIAVEIRPWAAEAIIQVSASHRDDWRDWRTWWNRHGAGPWVVTQQQNGRYIHHRSYGNWRGWRIVILHMTEDEQ